MKKIYFNLLFQIFLVASIYPLFLVFTNKRVHHSMWLDYLPITAEKIAYSGTGDKDSENELHFYKLEVSENEFQKLTQKYTKTEINEIQFYEKLTDTQPEWFTTGNSNMEFYELSSKRDKRIEDGYKDYKTVYYDIFAYIAYDGSFAYLKATR